MKSLQRSFDIPLCCFSFATLVANIFYYALQSNIKFEIGLDRTDLVDTGGLMKNLCLCLISISLMTAVAARRCLGCRLCPMNMEWVTLVTFCVTHSLQMTFKTYYLNAIWGSDAKREQWVDCLNAIWEDAACTPFDIRFQQQFGIANMKNSSEVGDGLSEELEVVMVLTFMITLACVVFPIRSHVLWLFPTFGIGFFCSLTYVASSPWDETLPKIVGYLCVMSVVAVWGGFRKEAYLRKEWLAQQEVEKQMDISEMHRQGFSHLLHRMSDCLLLLGPELEILDACPRLTAMLMLDGKKKVQGTFFSDYFASGHDRDSFVAAMGRDISETEPSGIMPLHLKDSCCRDVQVHAYYTSFYTKDGSRSFIVGIVEAEERKILDAVAPLAPPDKAERGLMCSLDGEGPLSSVSGSGDSSVLSLHTIGDDVGEISIVLSCHPGNRVMSCSPGFTALCGAPCGGVQFEDWLVNSSDLAAFIDEGVQDFIDNSLFAEKLVLRIPGSTRDYIAGETTMDCITYTGMDAAQDQQFTVRLRLEALRTRRKPKEKKKIDSMLNGHFTPLPRTLGSLECI